MRPATQLAVPGASQVSGVATVAYVGLVLALTLLPVFGVKSNEGPVVHLVPFETIRTALSHDFRSSEFVLLVGNVALFAPLGVLLSNLAARPSLGIAIGAGLALSAAIELTQLGLSVILGHSYRTADVDDVILNVGGCLAGYCAFRVSTWRRDS